MVDESAQRGAMVALTCESEFGAARDEFQTYLHRLTHHVLVRRPTSVENLAGQDWIGGGPTVEAAQRQFSEGIGESVGLTRMACFSAPRGFVWTYQAPDNHAAVMFAMATETPREEARDVMLGLASQVLSQRAWGLVASEGGLEETFDPFDLVDRPWERDPSSSVQAVLEESLGPGTAVEAFACFRIGS
jgi:translation elongation factor EF-Ts